MPYSVSINHCKTCFIFKCIVFIMSVDAFGPTQNINGLSRIVYYRMTAYKTVAQHQNT